MQGGQVFTTLVVLWLILQETKTATAVSNQITIDEETEGVIPEIVLPPFSQKETYLDVKVSNDLTKHEHEIQLTNEVPIQQKPYPLPLASCWKLM